MKTITFEDNYLNPELTSEIPGHCQVFLEVHSSSKFEEAYASNLPVVFTCVVGCLFLVMACVFSLYDSFVQHRNRKILGAAARSNAIVSQVFPTAVREKLMAEAAHQQKGTLKGFLTGGGGGDAGQSDNLSSQPIADFFPETTVVSNAVGSIFCNLDNRQISSSDRHSYLRTLQGSPLGALFENQPKSSAFSKLCTLHSMKSPRGAESLR